MSIPDAEDQWYAELNRVEPNTKREPHLTSGENVALGDARVEDPDRLRDEDPKLTRREAALAACRLAIARGNAHWRQT